MQEKSFSTASAAGLWVDYCSWAFSLVSSRRVLGRLIPFHQMGFFTVLLGAWLLYLASYLFLLFWFSLRLSFMRTVRRFRGLVSYPSNRASRFWWSWFLALRWLQLFMVASTLFSFLGPLPCHSLLVRACMQVAVDFGHNHLGRPLTLLLHKPK